MNVVFSFQKNKSPKTQKQNITFEAGLTPKIMQEIQQADVLKISSKLTQKGIPTDFKGNKVVAWCGCKTVEIFEFLNNNYYTNLALPKGIYVEDFANLNINCPTSTGFCNHFPLKNTYLKKNSNTKFEGETIFFNTFETLKNQTSEQFQFLPDWMNIDEVSNLSYADKFAPTDHFLDVFIHEFSHSAHEERLRKKIGDENLKLQMRAFNSSKNKEAYIQKYEKEISTICQYALKSPFEAIACDMSRVITDVLDKETLIPTKNPFIGTPYERLSLWRKLNIPYYTDEERPLNEILRNFWNGKFD